MAKCPSADARNNVEGASVAARARLTAGAEWWVTHADTELGIPALRFSDGPNGVRGPLWDERLWAHCTPCGTALAASWDTDLIARVGALVGDEARRQDVQVVLGPTLNIPRSPLGGRAFECYSEDPLLAGSMAAAWIGGVQARGVAACPKHFVANDSETSRTTVNCIIDERALREIYLLPFEHALRAGAWALMAAYNKVNGTHAAEHRGLLRELVKGEWGWDGLVVSDWFATRDTVACALAGLDLEMPGPGRSLGPALIQAVEAGLVPESELDDKVVRLRRLAHRVTAGSVARGTTLPPDTTMTSSAYGLMTEAAAAGFVLLKNSTELLPLQRSQKPLQVAVIGPNAVRPCLQGGGSAEVNMPEVRSLVTALQERIGPAAALRVETGCSNPAAFSGLHELSVRAGRETEGALEVEYIADAQSTPPLRETRRTSLLAWDQGVPGMGPGVTGRIRVSALLTPEFDGPYAFSVRGSGATRVLVDGQEIAALPGQARPEDLLAAWFSDELGVGATNLRARVPVLVEIEMLQETHNGVAMLEYGCRPPEPTDLLVKAVTAAREADVVLLVVGTGRAVESESQDRTSTALPGTQDALVRAVLAANPNTAVLVNAAAPVAMPWVDEAHTIMYCWFPGEAFADALAAVVIGDLEPGGRLPITLAARAEQYPAYNTTPDDQGRLLYEESTFVGYRHFDTMDHEPAFCFGHGMGYTQFRYQNLTLSCTRIRPGEGLSVIVRLCNTGLRAGKDVVQVYVSAPESEVAFPPRELRAFTTVKIAPGESAEVTLSLDDRAFSYWDSSERGWRMTPGRHLVQVGRSSRDLRLSQAVHVDARDASVRG